MTIDSKINRPIRFGRGCRIKPIPDSHVITGGLYPFLYKILYPKGARPNRFSDLVIDHNHCCLLPSSR